jgi:hypothetical protein
MKARSIWPQKKAKTAPAIPISPVNTTVKESIATDGKNNGGIARFTRRDNPAKVAYSGFFPSCRPRSAVR